MALIDIQEEPPFLVQPGCEEKIDPQLIAAYQAAEPFPHIVLDNFLPRALCQTCLQHFPPEKRKTDASFDTPQQRWKTGYRPDTLSSPMRSLFYSFNSLPFLDVIKRITGIKDLISDPYFRGAGFHETRQGGHLDVHTDFNHHQFMNLERRVNVLIYLNEDWQDDYGGALELWQEDGNAPAVTVVPILGRCVIFSTTDKSFHGHPGPVSHPEGRPRRSIALYYYTATWKEDGAAKSTQWLEQAKR